MTSGSFVSAIFLGLLATDPRATAQAPASLEARIAALVDADAPRLTEVFKDLHRNPELGFQEVRTAGIVAQDLKSLGYEVKTGIAGTGVAAILANGAGPVVMYRADMDCNAVKEATGLPWASTKVATRTGADGREEEVPLMHACGHDAHVTWMLGVAKAMTALKSEWKGTLVLIAQPAEEIILGAEAMVKDGLYERHGVPRPDHLLGLHTAPLSTGTVVCVPGEIMAGSDQIDVTFHGVGGHGSSPHLARDPVLMACAAVVQYQFIVSRGIDPQHAAVVTVGSVQAGSDNNVIPGSALLKLSLRWFDEQDRTRMIDAIERINQSIASAYGLSDDLRPKMVLKGGVKVLANDSALARVVTPALERLVGEANVMTSMPKVMGSEDFHHLVLGNEKRSYLFMQVGTAAPEHVARAHAEGRPVPYAPHNAEYVVDLAAIPVGAKVGIAALLEVFAHPPE